MESLKTQQTRSSDLFEGGAANQPDDFCAGKELGSCWLGISENPPDRPYRCGLRSGRGRWTDVNNFRGQVD